MPEGLRLRHPTPREAGYRWPAEWERHQATWIAWPHDPDTWGEVLCNAEAAFARAVAALGTGEQVHVLVKDATIGRRAQVCLEAQGARGFQIHRVVTRDAWIRDYGPIIVAQGSRDTRRRLALDFVFNAWGGKYPELAADDGVPRRLVRIHAVPARRIPLVLEGGSIDGNGRGTLLTTEQCLLDTNRNPTLSKEEIEWALRETLGVSHVLWLGEGIAGDDTDGHVDDMARFVGPRTVVACTEPDPQDVNHAPLLDNLRRLRAMADQHGKPLEVVELPMPTPVRGSDGGRLPASYANFYVGNRAVLVPTFGQATDARALRILQRCFRRRRVVGVGCEHIVEGLGALHCLTQQLPA